MLPRAILFRLLLVGLALPAAAVAVDEMAIAYAQGHRWSDPVTAAVFGWFAVQTCCLSYAAGRCLPS